MTDGVVTEDGNKGRHRKAADYEEEAATELLRTTLVSGCMIDEAKITKPKTHEAARTHQFVVTCRSYRLVLRWQRGESHQIACPGRKVFVTWAPIREAAG